MSETAAYLRDELLPEVPYRQWVLTVPWTLRARLSVDRRLLRDVLSSFLRPIFAWQRRRGRSLGISEGETGAVTFLQRFGGALNVHPHFHSLIPDGLFVPVPGREGLEFVPLPAPSAEEVRTLTERIAARITKRVRKLVEEEGELGTRLGDTALAMESSLLAAMRVPVPDAGLLLGDGDHESESVPESGSGSPRSEGGGSAGRGRSRLCAKVAGFSLHAGRSVDATDREALERLCRYGLRAPFSQERFSLAADGRVIYRLPRPWPHSAGVTELVLEGTELLARLVALVPAPYMNMTRYHGVFASRSKWRSRLPAPTERWAAGEAPGVPGSPTSPGFVPGAESASGDVTRGSSTSVALPPGPGSGSGGALPAWSSPAPTTPEKSPPPSLSPPSPPPRRRQRIPWSVLLARVFYLDALLCPKCGGRRKVLAFLTDPEVVRKILLHLGLETAPPALAPVRMGERDLRLWEWEAGGLEWDEGDVVQRERGEGDSGDGDGERGPP